MSLWSIQPSSSEPVFQQIVNAVKRAVATGRLRPDDKLPSVRELAKELVVNPNTVARAYQVLESEGVTLSRRGAGTFVAERRVVLRRDAMRRQLEEALEAALADAVNQGLGEEDLRRTFETVLRRFAFEEGGKG